MSKYIFLYYIEERPSASEKFKYDYYKPDICVFTSKEKLYEVLEKTLENEVFLHLYTNKNEIFDYIIENGGYIIMDDAIEVRIEKKKLNNYSNKKLNWGLKSKKTIEDIIDEVGQLKEKWVLFKKSDLVDEIDFSDTAEKMNIIFSTLKEAKEWVEEFYNKKYNLLLNTENKILKIGDIPTLKFPRNNIKNWEKDPKYTLYEIPEEKTKYENILLLKYDTELYFVSL